MATVDVKALAARYLSEMPVLQLVVDRVVSTVKTEAQVCQLSRVDVFGRVKDPVSFVRKAMAKGYADPWTDITDKAGVRAIGTYLGDCQRVGQLIENLFELAAPVDDKREALGEDKLGYGGAHYQIKMPVAVGDGARIIQCEVQVRTRAEDVWARVSHELLYKGRAQLPGMEKRRVYRIAALVEMFDRDADEAREAMSKGEFAEGLMLDVAERELFALTGSMGTDELSLRVARGLRGLYDADVLLRFEGYLREFVSAHRPKLQEIFSTVTDDSTHPFLFRPEGLLIFDRLENDLFGVQDAWEGMLPPVELDRMASLWGVALPERR